MPGKKIFVSALRRKDALVIVGVLLIGGATVALVLRNSSSGSPRLTPAKASSTDEVSVQVALPERNEITKQVVLAGSVEAIEQATLYARISGYLKSIKVDIGDRVSSEVLAEIDVPEMGPEYQGAEAEVERAKMNIENARAELERARAELELKRITYERLNSIREQEPDVMPQQQVDEAKAQFEVARAMVSVAEAKIKVHRSEVSKAEASRARLATLMEYTKIHAPFSGVIVKRHVDPGALIQQASSQTNVSPVVTVARVDTLRVFVDVAEPEISFVKKGSPVTLRVDSLPGRVFKGTCTRYAGALDPKTRTMRTQIDLPNRDGVLRPGMYAEVVLSLGQKQDVLTVPASALIIEGEKSYVYTATGGKARRVEVRTGSDDGIRVEITDGLTGAEPVITNGKNLVKDGTPVRVSAASS